MNESEVREHLNGFNKELVSLIRKQLKADAGVKKIRTGYRGTGSRSHRYQIWIGLANGESFDLWIETLLVSFGGASRTSKRISSISIGTKTPPQVYAEIVEGVRTLAQP